MFLSELVKISSVTDPHQSKFKGRPTSQLNKEVELSILFVTSSNPSTHMSHILMSRCSAIFAWMLSTVNEVNCLKYLEPFSHFKIPQFAHFSGQ